MRLLTKYKPLRKGKGVAICIFVFLIILNPTLLVRRSMLKDLSTKLFIHKML